ncbi:MAG: hypothetical protein HDS71_04935 [Bacteroidales bacterium]|nr:hypothetical protein [Bacteroidales bacterium]MBD5347665.1 hypothetical protein [Bacteroides sp.]
MIQRILFTLCLAIVSFTAGAHYTLHSVSGDVKVESGGKTVSAAKGMTVKAIDYIIIPKGGKVEILNGLDKRIYTSITPGRISVTRLMIDARGAASDNAKNVASRMNLGRKSPNDSKNVYVEKGMVRRSLAVYDPEGEMMEMDAETLGKYVAARLNDTAGIATDTCPVNLTSTHLQDGGLAFKLENTLGFPVYFNVLRVKKGEKPTVEISQLGQPAGSYVVLPRQTISREHFPTLDPAETHLVVITNCQYDVDKVIEEITKALENKNDLDGSARDLPVYIDYL